MLDDELPMGGVSITIPDNDSEPVSIDPETGDVETRHADGSVTYDFGAAKKKTSEEDDDFYRNLANDVGGMLLTSIAEELLEGIAADDESRHLHLANIDRGLDLLGLELKDPKSTVSDGSNPVEGMSSVTNPLLLEACVKTWATAVGEFLPSMGPVKIDEEGDLVEQYRDPLAEALERDMNYYFMSVAKEYYPQTSHMLLWGVNFAGAGFKKVYRCPERRRPVSEKVDTKDLIVSNGASDFSKCSRITHRIWMEPSQMRRMQIAGHYLDVPLTQPTPQSNTVDEKIAQIQGTRALPDRPEDQPYEVYETQALIDIPQFAEGTKFADKKLQLPYLVTIEKESRKVLALRRDWDEDDEECRRLKMYVRWPFIPGPGFYCTGLLNMLGNSSSALTAAWRMSLDAGMFASFPGGIIAKDGNRQNSSMLRVAPGEYAPVDAGGKDIRTVVMGLPYHDASPGLMAMIDKILQQSEALRGAVETPTQSGIANVPVGTMLAHIEQATQVQLATHRGMHTAQSEEFELIFDLFRRHPEDFWRDFPKEAKAYWNEALFLQALQDVALVPRSDPNTPSHLHRIAMALGLVELTQNPMFAPMLNPQEVLRRVLQAMRVDTKGLLQAPPPQQAPPDLKGEAAMLTAQAKIKEADSAAGQAQQKAEMEQQKFQDQKQIEQMRTNREEIVHQGDIRRADQEHQADMASKAADVQMAQQQHALDSQAQQNDLAVDHAKFGLAVQTHQHERQMAEQTHQHERQMAVADQQHQQGLAAQAQEHSQGLAEDQQGHGQGMAEDQQSHQQKLAEKYPPQQAKSGGTVKKK